MQGLSDTAPQVPAVGEEWVYRVSDGHSSTRVRVLAQDNRKRSVRFDVEFLDGDRCGETDNVPGVRLRQLWVNVGAYDKLMADRERLRSTDLNEAEEYALDEVFRLLIPEDVAVLQWNPVAHSTVVFDAKRLEDLIGSPLDHVVAQVETAWLDDHLQLSAEGSLMVAELACRRNPEPVLDAVLADERRLREECKRGHDIRTTRGNEGFHVSPEESYEWYIERERPRHELLRQWCGHRQITAHERLLAAEAEVRRLDILVAELIDDLRESGKEHVADVMEQRHNEERVTAANIRPAVVGPQETEVRYVEVPRRRRWSS